MHWRRLASSKSTCPPPPSAYGAPWPTAASPSLLFSRKIRRGTLSSRAAAPNSFEASRPVARITSLSPNREAPGVIESKSNFIEHPELIANRISNYAKLVGRENVIAGSDCGYGTWVGQAAVDPDIVWAKLAALSEGARLASQRFWR